MRALAVSRQPTIARPETARKYILLGEGFPPSTGWPLGDLFQGFDHGHTVVDMSGLHPTDNRYCDDENNASDSESSDDEVEEGLLVERNREMLLGKSTFYMCLSTLDE